MKKKFLEYLRDINYLEKVKSVDKVAYGILRMHIEVVKQHIKVQDDTHAFVEFLYYLESIGKIKIDFIYNIPPYISYLNTTTKEKISFMTWDRLIWIYRFKKDNLNLKKLLKE